MKFRLILTLLAVVVLVFTACGDDDPVVTPPAPDTKAPTVLSVVPADSSTNVPTNTSIVVTFSENMAPNTGDGVFLTPNPGGLRTTTIIGDVVTLMYTNLLAAGTEHTVTVTTAVEDEAGNSLETEFTSVFTTFFVIPHPGPIRTHDTRFRNANEDEESSD